MISGSVHRELYGEPCRLDTGPPLGGWCGDRLVPIEPEYDSRWFWDLPSAGVPADQIAQAGPASTS